MDSTVLLYVDKGALKPANEQAAALLREKGLRVGDFVVAKLRKPRNSQFWRLAHELGSFCSDNIPKFEKFNSHQVLKELQKETGLECDVSVTDIPDVGRFEFKKPRSLSFDNMDDARFSMLMRGFARHISEVYMPGMEERQIIDLLSLLPRGEP